MRPLFWPSRPVALSITAPTFRPSHDLVLAAIVAAATMTVSWTVAMVAALVIMSQ